MNICKINIQIAHHKVDGKKINIIVTRIVGEYRGSMQNVIKISESKRKIKE